MDQKSLYTVFKEAGCIVLTFEDYPNDGSWRANFLINHNSCEIISNRRDLYLILRSKSVTGEYRKVIECKSVHDDDFDLTCVSNWLDFGLLNKS